MVALAVNGASGSVFSGSFFGGNFLFNRDRLGIDGTYDDVAESLGISHVRYPGGSITEAYFDLSNPDATSATEDGTGRIFDLTPFSEFMSWAEAEGKIITIVIPTARYIGSQVDENGDRFAALDEDEIRGFVRDTLDGAYGAPQIAAFEIGNEYWGHGLSTAEYGRIAAEMAVILEEEIVAHGGSGLDDQIDILVQAGSNYGSANLAPEYAVYGTPQDQVEAIIRDYDLDVPVDLCLYGNGQVAWPKVQNLILLAEMRDTAGFETIDGLTEHLYSLAPEMPATRSHSLDVANQTWLLERPDLELHVTEWNVATQSPLLVRNEDYGLRAAQEMLEMSEAMLRAGVDAAHIWPVQQNTPNDLSGNEGQVDLTVQGQMFRMMQESLEGTQSIRFTGAVHGEDEAESGGAELHGFFAPDRMVMFVAAGGGGANADFDTGGLFSGQGAIRVTRLGVPDGENPTSADAPAEVTELEPTDVFADGILSVQLEPWEILQVVIDSPDWTPGFLAATDPDPAPTPSGFFQNPVPPPMDATAGPDANDDPLPAEEDEMAEVDDGGGGGMGGIGLLLLLPLMLMGLGGS